MNEQGARDLPTASLYLEKLLARRYRNGTIVIKYGGAAMGEADAVRDRIRVLLSMVRVGANLVLVHGGGLQVGQLLNRLSMPVRFERGMRVTDPEIMQVVQMVLGGRVNQDIVRAVNAAGCRAVGLTGVDAGLLLCRKWLGDGGVDLGLVGEVVKVDGDLLKALLERGFVPVIAPLGTDAEGGIYNVNADIGAGAIAGHLKAELLLLLTDTPGVMDEEGRLVVTLSAAHARELDTQGVIKGGMVPKVRCALQALAAGVSRVGIVDGRDPGGLLEFMSGEGAGGTWVVADTS